MNLRTPTEALQRRFNRNVKVIQTLIWIYFFLLLFEGSMRMLLPSLSTALLVVRDPFLLAAYAFALAAGIFPWNRFVVLFWLLGLVAATLAWGETPPLVIMYGFRAAFLHVPLIFLMPRVFKVDDVIAFGRWFLILALPMAILMAVQFHVGPDSWLNRGLDNQFTQIDSAEGKIRPPGTFSYIIGPALFFASVIAFVLYDQFHKGRYPKWLIILAASSTCLALGVSGSRTALATVSAVLIAATIAVLVAKPKAITGLVKFAMVAGIALAVVSQLPIFDEGVGVFSQRIENASGNEGGFSGFIRRAFSEPISAYDDAMKAPSEGAGLGVGSNVGATLLTGRAGFLLAEAEWPRMILELGPFVGTAFLGMRVGLLAWMLGLSLRRAKAGSMLPVLLLGACGLGILNGVWGQPTVLGFAMFGSGLCLAAMRQESPKAATVP